MTPHFCSPFHRGSRMGDYPDAAVPDERLKAKDREVRTYIAHCLLDFIHSGLIVCVCSTHFLFTSSRPHTITPSHHHILTSSHHHTLTSSYPHILTPSYHHIIIPSHHHTFTSSYHTITYITNPWWPSHIFLLILTSSLAHPHTITPSQLEEMRRQIEALQMMMRQQQQAHSDAVWPHPLLPLYSILWTLVVCILVRLILSYRNYTT